MQTIDNSSEPVLEDFSMPVHKGLQQVDLLLGVPKIVFALILVVTVVTVYLFGKWFALLGAALYVPCRILTKIDPDMITVSLSSLMEPDILEG